MCIMSYVYLSGLCGVAGQLQGAWFNRELGLLSDGASVYLLPMSVSLRVVSFHHQNNHCNFHQDKVVIGDKFIKYSFVKH